MAERYRSAFFAFPAGPNDLTDTIHAAAKAIASTGAKIGLTLWPQLEIFGAHIPDEVRQGIDGADVLVADITRPNRNVYYEIGYAIGKGKSIAPVLNSAFADAVATFARTASLTMWGMGSTKTRASCSGYY